MWYSVDLLLLIRCGRLLSCAASAQRANLMLLSLLPVLLLWCFGRRCREHWPRRRWNEISVCIIRLFFGNTSHFVPCLFITIFVLHLNSCNFTFSNYMSLWRCGSMSSSHPVDPGSIPGASIVFEWHILSSREWFNLNDIIKLLHNLLWITVSLNSFWDHILDTFSFALFERSKWAFFTCRIRP